ncbi:hypothetical protein [Actinokineospora globicatena]|uniref:Uncharacterized protein n=1 Tax=Actinokineospora globicatena TaxID=103729 RepID=A0A9W6QUW2_9PSEU|nr:hypothetical protein [Actinokineospora globicatena]GLW95290.1 hypothetical protein Aglo03_61060 [Actinokineospora globicatena]
MRTDEFEGLLRDALDHQAAQAPSGARVLAALAPRSRRRWWIPVGGAVAAALVGIAMLPTGEQNQQVAPGTSLGVTSPAAAGQLVWEPAWVPPGMVERERSAGPDGPWVASKWSSGSATTAPQVNVMVTELSQDDQMGPDASREQVVVNGHPGQWYDNDNGHDEYMIAWWTGSKRFTVTSYAIPEPRPVLLRVAESLRAAVGEPVQVPITMPELPGTVHGWVGVRGDQPDQAVMFSQVYLDRVGTVRAEVRPERPSTEGTRVPVRGGDGWWYRVGAADPNEPTEVLMADLGGRWLVVSFAPYDPHDATERLDLLTTVANSVTAGSTPAAPWLGRTP